MNSRRSARVKAAKESKRTIAAKNKTKNTGTAGAISKVATPSAHKSFKPKVSLSKRKKVIHVQGENDSYKGSLSSFFHDMPLDVLLETFSHLTTQDLLKLIRINKSCRGLLLDRAAASATWRQARWNFRPMLPQLPEDMSEPEYANLLFDTHCHVCNKPRSLEIIWAARIRCCKECLADCFYVQEDLEKWMKEQEGITDEICRDFVLADLIPGVPAYDDWGRERWYYSFEILKTYLEEYKKVLEIPDTRAKDDWLERHRQDIKNRQEHAILCDEWLEARKDDRARALAEMKERRGEQILERLCKEGWQNEVSKMSAATRYNFMTLPTVRQPKELSDTEWRTIKRSMHDFMARVQTKRLRQERVQLVGKRCGVFMQALNERGHSQNALPRYAELADMECFRSVILETPEDEEFTTETFSDTLSQLPKLVETWRQKVDGVLLELLQSSGIYEDRTADRLDLASPKTAFECGRCRTTLSYPVVLEHGCAISVPWWAHREFNLRFCSNEDEWSMIRAFGQVPWSSEQISYNFHLHASRVSLFETMGFNLKSLEWDEIHRESDTLVGLVEYSRTVFNWRSSSWQKDKVKFKGPYLTVMALRQAIRPCGAEKRFSSANPSVQWVTLHPGWLERAGYSSFSTRCRHCEQIIDPNECSDHSQSGNCPKSYFKLIQFELFKAKAD